MTDKLNLGIEISQGVLNSKMHNKIERYVSVEKETIKEEMSDNSNKLYRYRPGVNFNMIGDLDV